MNQDCKSSLCKKAPHFSHNCSRTNFLVHNDYHHIFFKHQDPSPNHKIKPKKGSYSINTPNFKDSSENYSIHIKVQHLHFVHFLTTGLIRQILKLLQSLVTRSNNYSILILFLYLLANKNSDTLYGPRITYVSASSSIRQMQPNFFCRHLPGSPGQSELQIFDDPVKRSYRSICNKRKFDANDNYYSKQYSQTCCSEDLEQKQIPKLAQNFVLAPFVAYSNNFENNIITISKSIENILKNKRSKSFESTIQIINDFTIKSSKSLENAELLKKVFEFYESLKIIGIPMAEINDEADFLNETGGFNSKFKDLQKKMEQILYGIYEVAVESHLDRVLAVDRESGSVNRKGHPKSRCIDHQLSLNYKQRKRSIKKSATKIINQFKNIQEYFNSFGQVSNLILDITSELKSDKNLLTNYCVKKFSDDLSCGFCLPDITLGDTITEILGDIGLDGTGQHFGEIKVDKADVQNKKSEKVCQDSCENLFQSCLSMNAMAKIHQKLAEYNEIYQQKLLKAIIDPDTFQTIFGSSTKQKNKKKDQEQIYFEKSTNLISKHLEIIDSIENKLKKEATSSNGEQAINMIIDNCGLKQIGIETERNYKKDVKDNEKRSKRSSFTVPDLYFWGFFIISFDLSTF